MMTRHNLLLLPTVKLPAARKTLSSTLVIHPLHQVWNHPGTLVSCLIQPVVLMIVWTNFAKILTISCIPSVKFESTLTNPRLKNDKFGSDIPFGLLQQPSVWYQWILSVSATTLPEYCCAHCLLTAEIWPYNTSIERSTLAASWVQNKLQDPVAGLQGSTWHGSTLLVITTVALQTWEVSTTWG